MEDRRQAVAGTDNRQPANATEALERLGRLSLRDLSMDDLLQTIAELAKSVMPGEPEASVTVLLRDEPSTVASTGRLALDLDETQYDRGQGPCLHAARTGELTEISDTRTDSRWRDYSPRAAEAGNLSSLSVPLAVDKDEQVSGALNLYAREPDAFDEDSRSAAQAFGAYAAVATGNLYAYQSVRSMADNLQIALQSRAVIDQAKGILMERLRLTPDQAFQLLAQASMGANLKVRDVAEQLVHTGELPAPSAGRSPRPRRSTPGRSDEGAAKQS
jgi:GAF domain-containing protein